MSADPPYATRSSAAHAPPGEVSQAGGWRRSRFPRVLVIAALLLGLGFGGWTWFTLNWAYSEGDRAGVLQKLSRKGWVCKTWEGELAQYVVAGVAPRIWSFSVRDPRIAERLARDVGRSLQLHYTEHVGIPTSCFGETPYFVRGVTPMRESPAFAPLPAAATAPSSPTETP